MSLYSSASDYAKDTWLPVYTNQLAHAEGSWLDQLGMNTDSRVKIEGRKAFMKIQVGDDKGFTVLGQGSDFGAPGDIDSKEATLELMRFNDSISFDSHEWALLDSLNAAAAPIMQQKMTSARSRTLREIERMAIMDGSGKIAKVSSVSGTTLNFDVVGSEYAERNAYTWIDDPNRSRYRIVDATTGADALTTPSSFTLSSINEAGNSAVASATLTGAVAGNYVVNDYGQTAFTSGGAYTSREMKGLLALIDDANTYLGLSRSSVPQWKATVIANSGTLRPITEDLIDTLMNKTARRSESGAIVPADYIATASPGTWTSYHNLMRNGIRYTVAERPDIGWGGRSYLDMDGVPLYKHVNSPRNQILLIHRRSVGFVGPRGGGQSGVFQFLDGPQGSIFFQSNASSGQGHADKVFAYIVGWLGMYSERPRNHARLDDITETSGAY